MRIRLLNCLLFLTVSCSCAAGTDGTQDADSLGRNDAEAVIMALPSIVFDDSTGAMVPFDGITGLKSKWDEGDAVGVYSEEGGYSRFTVSSGAGNSGAVFDGQGVKLSGGARYVALYPYDHDEKDIKAFPIDYGDFSVTGNNNLEDLIPFDPLYATATADEKGAANFNFSHVSSIAHLECTLPSAGTFTRIDLLPAYGGIVEDGKFDIWTGEWTPGTPSLVRAIPVSGVTSTTSDRDLSLWIPLAPQDLSAGAMAAIIYDTDGKAYTARLKGGNYLSGTVHKWETEMRELSVSSTGSGVAITSTRDMPLLNVPAGQYSGISQISETRYAVVHDSAKGGGIYFFDLEFNNNGSLRSCSYSIPDGTEEAADSRDPEGVAFFPYNNTLFVSGEGDQKILEYDMDGFPTGRSLEVPDDMSESGISGNAGFEALDYNDFTKTFWTTTEASMVKDTSYTDLGGGLLRLQSFNFDLSPSDRYLYVLDRPQKSASTARNYAYGVPDILSLDDGRLLIIEREAYIPKGNFLEIAAGTVVYLKLYEVNPVQDKGGVLSKKLVKSFTIQGALNYANYEGICFGPVINEKRTLLMISDSQNKYQDLLQDWLMVLFVSGI